MIIVDIALARKQLSALIERAAKGEEIVISKAGELVATLAPYQAKVASTRRPGALKGKIWISPDFDKPDSELEAMFYDGPIEPA